MGKIIGTGFQVPIRVVLNREITHSDKWVEDNLGIKERRRGNDWMGTLFLGLNAGMYALQTSGRKAKDIDMLIVATSTPEKIAPSTACLIQKELGLNNAVAFDINAVCSGFLFALSIAEQYLSIYKNIMIIGVDMFSSITDYTDRNCVFFGDGAGAVVLTRGSNLKSIVIKSTPQNDGFSCKQGSTFIMNGKEVYKNAIKLLPNVINEALGDIKIDEIDYMIPHQPSKKILLDVGKLIGIKEEKVLMNMDKYANTSAATIPILLAESWDKFKTGDKLLMAAIGSGWTFAAAVYEV